MTFGLNFGSILGSQNCPKFGVFFWIVFFTILGRGVTLVGLRWDFDAGVCAAEPPRAAPFSRAEGSYNDPGTQARDPTRPWPEAQRITYMYIAIWAR